jgi:hypothetical protein
MRPLRNLAAGLFSSTAPSCARNNQDGTLSP